MSVTSWHVKTQNFWGTIHHPYKRVVQGYSCDVWLPVFCDQQREGFKCTKKDELLTDIPDFTTQFFVRDRESPKWLELSTNIFDVYTRFEIRSLDLAFHLYLWS